MKLLVKSYWTSVPEELDEKMGKFKKALNRPVYDIVGYSLLRHLRWEFGTTEYFDSRYPVMFLISVTINTQLCEYVTSVSIESVETSEPAPVVVQQKTQPKTVHKNSDSYLEN